MRLGLIKDQVTLPSDEGFILCDKTGTEQVRLVSIIGNGGTALAYKAIRNRNGSKSVCIVKEYFPEEEYEEGIYIRNEVGKPIRIPDEYREEELSIQKKNIQRELDTNQKIYFDVNSDDSNNPYVYQSELFATLGDSSYLVIDTNEGNTLYSIMRQNPTPEECLRYIYQLLIIVEHLNKKGFVHGDIKPENIWVRGNSENQSMLLLDFGTVISLEEYYVPELSKLSTDEVFSVADAIAENEGLGSTTEYYGSLGILKIRNHKRLYRSTDPSYERAVKLVKAVNELSIADDLFSVVKVLCELFENSTVPHELKAAIEETLDAITEKNQTSGYHTIDALKKDIEVIETILDGGAHPAVLENNLRKAGYLNLPEDFTEELLCELE